MPKKANKTSQRKKNHLEICIKKNIEFKNKSTGFEDIELVYKTLPELHKNEISLKTKIFGKNFNFPIMINAMTGGVKKAEKINQDLAIVAEEFGIPFGLGSQRAMIENKKLAKTYKVRKKAKDVFLIGNIGVSELRTTPLKEIVNALNTVDADALAIHLNAAQEIMQLEGNKNFLSCIEIIEEISEKFNLPIYVKEVGNGIDMETARALEKTKINAVDVGGAGGTSWVAIDSLLGGNGLSNTFWDFGIPTAVSLFEVKAVSKKPLIASGGIRSGLDVAKSISLGAEMTGIALPILKAYHKGKIKGVRNYLEKIINETKTAMFLTGAKNIKELQEIKPIITGKTKDWLEQRQLM